MEEQREKLLKMSEAREAASKQLESVQRQVCDCRAGHQRATSPFFKPYRDVLLHAEGPQH